MWPASQHSLLNLNVGDWLQHHECSPVIAYIFSQSRVFITTNFIITEPLLCTGLQTRRFASDVQVTQKLFKIMFPKVQV